MSQAVVGKADRRGAQRLIARYLEDARRIARGRAENGTSNTAPISDPSAGPLTHQHVRDLVEPNLFYVVQAASEYRSAGVPFEDLLAEGNIGLVEAAHRYDSGHGVKFLTYASWWIRKRILDYLSNEGKAVRLTRYARERRRDLSVLRDALRSDLGRDPSNEEIAHASGLDLETVQERLSANPKVMSIDQPSSTYGTLFERLADRNHCPAEERIDQARMSALVRREVAKLPQRERRIIENRFGLDGREALTFQDLGEALGLSRERARQLEREALRRLRKRLQRVLAH
jgi:RNA polymerase primary sigma factor